MKLPDLPVVFDALVERTRAHLLQRRIAQPRIIGIQTGGVLVAERLRAALAIDEPIGTLDISFHRDDYGSAGLHPLVRPSQLPWDVNDQHILLVDDVLHTGRTVRAALNEIFDWGRPASVSYAALIVRDGRELPIAADACGIEMSLSARTQIKLRGPEPLRLELAGEHA